MKKFTFIIFFIVIILKLSGQVGKTKPLIVDYTSASKFKDIPDSVLGEIAAIKLMFRHASVGTTIDNGLYCIQGTRTNPAECKLFQPYKYDRRNWDFQPRGNSGWYGKIQDFVKETELQADSFNAFSFKYCYLDGLDQVAEPCGGANFKPSLVAKAWDSLRINMNQLEKKYPEKHFIWWTIPLTQPGMHCTDTLNFLIRNYAKNNNKILFDLADIQSHDSSGIHLTNSNGWEMAFSGYCGEKPPGPSCHPNWTGSIIMAKAFWWMMWNIVNDSIVVPNDTLPWLTTTAVSSVSSVSAVSGGNITDKGGSEIINRGVVWDILPNPTIALSTKTSDGAGDGIFISNISGLVPDTKYYIKAYATNSTGTGYGNEISFTTDVNGIIESEIMETVVFQNPLNGEVTVFVPSSFKQIDVYSISGKRIVFTSDKSQTSYQFHLENNGVYFIHILTDLQTITKKIVMFR